MSKNMKQGLVPELRFPEFRGSGEWEPKKLGDKDVSDFVKKRLPLYELALGTYVSTENILADFGGIKEASKLPPSGSFTAYESGDILIANIRPYLKKVWVANRSGGASNDVVVVRPRNGNGFLSCILRNETFINYVMQGAKGVKMPRGDIALMKEYPIAVPNSEEQKKIGDCLSSLDELIAAHIQKHQALQSYKKGLLQNLFPAEGETVPVLRFSEFRDAGDWHRGKLKKYIDLLSGYAFKSEYFSASGEKLLTPKNFTKSGFANFSEENTKFTVEECDSKYLCAEGDLLLLLTDLTSSCELLGKPILLRKDDGKVLLNQRIVKVIPSQKVNNQFLLYFFLTDGYSNHIKNTASGSTVRHSSNKIVLDTDISFPSTSEQQKIADCLSSVDDIIAAQAQKITELKAYKKGLMQQLFPSVDEVGA